MSQLLLHNEPDRAVAGVRKTWHYPRSAAPVRGPKTRVSKIASIKLIRNVKLLPAVISAPCAVLEHMYYGDVSYRRGLPGCDAPSLSAGPFLRLWLRRLSSPAAMMSLRPALRPNRPAVSAFPWQVH